MLSPCRIVYNGNLVCQSPLSTATGERGAAQDIVVLRDDDGWPMLSGPSLNGVLRRLAVDAARAAGRDACDHNDSGGCGKRECLPCRLFGSSMAPKRPGHAARVWLSHARLHQDDRGALSETRERVSIDRRFGTAADHLKFAREQVPSGARFLFRLEYEQAEDEQERQEDEALLAQVLLLLASDEGVPFGGGRSIGLGVVKLEDLSRSVIALDKPEALAGYLWGGNGWQPERKHETQEELGKRTAVFTPPQAAAGDIPISLSVEGVLQPLGPFIVKTASEMDLPLQVRNKPPQPHDEPWPDASWAYANCDDRCMPTVGLDADVYHTAHWKNGGTVWRACLPGSGIKGPLRSHAERMLRTRYHRLGQEEAKHPLHACAPQLREAPKDGSLRVACDTAEDRCWACSLFGNTRWAGRLAVYDALPVDEQAFTSRLKLLDFVSIDRWSGAPVDKAKFNARVFFPDGESDPAGRMSFRLRLTVAPDNAWQLHLLALLLRDMAAGRLHFGHGWSKGFGQMRLLVDKVAVTAAPGHPLLPSGAGWESGTLGWYRRLTLTCNAPPKDDRPSPAGLPWFLQPGTPTRDLFDQGREAWLNPTPAAKGGGND